MEQQFINTLLSIVSGLMAILGVAVAWWVNNIWAMVKAQQEEISKLHIELVQNYVPRLELQKTFERMFDKLDQIQREIKK